MRVLISRNLFQKRVIQVYLCVCVELALLFFSRKKKKKKNKTESAESGISEFSNALPRQ